MSAANVAGSASQPDGRKRILTGRIVPAVPLTMSKPRRQNHAKSAGPDVSNTKDVLQEQTLGQTTSGENWQEESGRGRASIGASYEAAGEHSERAMGSTSRDSTEGSQPKPRKSKPECASSSPSIKTANSTGFEGADTHIPPIQAGTANSGGRKPSRKSTKHAGNQQLRNESPLSTAPSLAYQTQSPRASGQQKVELPASIATHSSRASASSIVFGSHNSDSVNTASHSSKIMTATTPPASQARYPRNELWNRGLPPAESQFSMNPISVHSPPFTPWSEHTASFQPQLASSKSDPNASGRLRPGLMTPTETPATNGHTSTFPSRPSSTTIENQPHRPDSVFGQGKVMVPELQPPFTGQPPGQHHLPPTYSALQHRFPPGIQAGFQNFEMLAEHVRVHFNIPGLADCRLQITDEQGITNNLDCHKLILARSPFLLDLIQNSQNSQNIAATVSKAQIPLRLTGPYANLDAFSHALRYLYGGPLPAQERLLSASSIEQKMRIALEDIVSGLWLRVPALVSRAVDVAASTMHWDTIDQVLTFALEGGLSPIWLVEDGEDRSSSASSDDSHSRPESAGVPTYDPAATHLLHSVVDYVLHLFPVDFFLDTSAPQLQSSPRLPSILGKEGNRQSLPDPRLSQIRFGDMSSHQKRPTPTTTFISSMLLSLPFPILKVILEHPILVNRLGVDTVASIIRAVVVEREARRIRAFDRSEKRVSATHSIFFQSLYWVEGFEPSAYHRVGIKLVRFRKGIDTPASSGDGV